MNGYCAVCNKPLLTGDFNGVCRECREKGNREFNFTPSNSYATTKKKIKLDNYTYAVYDNVHGWYISKENV